MGKHSKALGFAIVSVLVGGVAIVAVAGASSTIDQPAHAIPTRGPAISPGNPPAVPMLDCPRNESFSAGETHDSIGCKMDNGDVRCYSKKHYPCAGRHTHGSLTYQEVRGERCVQVTRKAVRCDGDFHVRDRCGSSTTVDCGSGGSQTAGTFEE